MITVILNVYKRPYTLEAQLKAIKSQTIQISDENIWIWYNKSDVPQQLPQNNKHRTFQCNVNTKFHGRFTAALLAQTEYVAMFDDDIIPGTKWFENCITTIKQCNGILGSSGVSIKSKGYRPHEKYGWTGIHPNTTTRVDLVGHSWMYKQEWAKYMWYEKPVSWDNGEDIMFSFLCQKYGGINTFVPPHPDNNRELWGNLPEKDNGWGNDKNASFMINQDHYILRDKVCTEAINRGWKTVYGIK